MKRCLSVGNVSECTDPSDLCDLMDPRSSGTIAKKSRKQRKNDNNSVGSVSTASQSIIDSIINTVAHSSDSVTCQSNAISSESSALLQVA